MEMNNTLSKLILLYVNETANSESRYGGNLSFLACKCTFASIEEVDTCEILL